MRWRRKDPLSLPICRGSLVLTSPAGRGAEVWERRVSPAMLPVGMGFGGPTPSVPAALAWPPGQRKPACPDSPCGSWSLQSCLPLPPPNPSLSVVPQKSPNSILKSVPPNQPNSTSLTLDRSPTPPFLLSNSVPSSSRQF